MSISKKLSLEASLKASSKISLKACPEQSASVSIPLSEPPAAAESLISSVEHDPRWQAVLTKDAHFDSQFVYAVKSTGVYCRPSSPSKVPKPKNIIFFDTPQQAEQAGYRPSKRPQADQSSLQQHYAQLVATACASIEKAILHAEIVPDLTGLAQQAGMSKYHFQRVFKQQLGLSPKAYAQAKRAEKLRDQLSNAGTNRGSVTEAIYDAGFNSSSRFYEKSHALLGMNASQYQHGGVNNQIRFALGETKLGAMIIAQSTRGICWIALGDDPGQLLQDLQEQFKQAQLIGADADFEQLVAKVVGFVEAPDIGLNLPLDIQGTAFQQRVWQALQSIPLGKTASYGEVAELIGTPRAVRAVASACAANKIALAIPCHRVIRQDGNLSGYRWGIERKRQLLQLESEQA